MKTRPLGCFSFSALLSALFTLAALGFVGLISGGAMFSPGELNAQSSGATLGGVSSHAELSAECAACHPPFWSAARMTDRCLACHTELLDETVDFHGMMRRQGLDTSCQSCHTEHHGQQASLTRSDLASFPHDLVGFSLRAHAAPQSRRLITCADCHLQTFQRPQAFQRPPAEVCADCHQSYQADFMRQHRQDFPDDCLACHDGWDHYSNFDHAATAFPLQGVHQDLACRACHFHIDEAGVTRLKGLPQTCLACHAEDEAHGGRYGVKCQDCHTPAGWKPAQFDHNLAAFKLEGKHQDVACQDCHRQADDGRTQYLGTPQTCSACHAQDDAHAGQLGVDCQRCHTPAGWKPAQFDHNLAAFRLEGKHQDVACQDCHRPLDVNGPIQYRGTPQTCSACHAQDDAHAGQLGSDCQRCHTTAGWKPAQFDHNLAAFKLEGRHQDVACQDCHRRVDVNGPIQYRGTPQACSACHAQDDAHAGQFGSDCQRCHSTAGWKPAAFDHSLASFQLTGAHVNVACRSCHTQGWGGTPSACVACHAEPAVHAGAFGTQCQECHSTSAWLPASFNGAHTFPMKHGHATGCRDCHTESLARWTCYTCHDAGKIAKKHTEEGIGDFSNCLRCHPDGREGEEKEDGGDDDD